MLQLTIWMFLGGFGWTRVSNCSPDSPQMTLNMAQLKGAEIDRFVSLLNRNIPFLKALQEARNPESEFLFPEEELLEWLRSYPDPWVYAAVKANCTTFATDFRRTFSDFLDRGKTIEGAADAALRKADSLATSRYGLVELRRPEAIKLGKFRLALANANAAPVTRKESVEVSALLRKKIMRDKDLDDMPIEFVPHIVDFSYMKRLGYIRVICADKATVGWLVDLLRLAQVWRNAPIFLMHERKFKRSCILSTCLKDSPCDEADEILGHLKKLNSDVKMSKWKILNRILLEDKKTLKIYTLIPRSDLKMLRLKKNELNYKHSKAKFTVLTTVDEDEKKSETVLLQGVFPGGDIEGDILEHIESENDDIDTFRWEVIRKAQLTENGVTYVWLKFYIDGHSADTIEQSNNEIIFMSQKVRLSEKIKPNWIEKFGSALK